MVLGWVWASGSSAGNTAPVCCSEPCVPYCTGWLHHSALRLILPCPPATDARRAKLVDGGSGDEGNRVTAKQYRIIIQCCINSSRVQISEPSEFQSRVRLHELTNKQDALSTLSRTPFEYNSTTWSRKYSTQKLTLQIHDDDGARCRVSCGTVGAAHRREGPTLQTRIYHLQLQLYIHIYKICKIVRYIIKYVKSCEFLYL